jgi:hypothetical protein
MWIRIRIRIRNTVVEKSMSYAFRINSLFKDKFYYFFKISVLKDMFSTVDSNKFRQKSGLISTGRTHLSTQRFAAFALAL